MRKLHAVCIQLPRKTHSVNKFCSSCMLDVVFMEIRTMAGPQLKVRWGLGLTYILQPSSRRLLSSSVQMIR